MEFLISRFVCQGFSAEEAKKAVEGHPEAHPEAVKIINETPSTTASTDSNTNYAVYWRPSNGPAYPADYQPGINRYFSDLAHDSGLATNVDRWMALSVSLHRAVLSIT